MKKLKLLTALSSVSILGMITLPLTSCSKGTTTQITKIEISAKPKKLFYFDGEKLDLTGLIVIASFSDGTKDDVTSQCTTNPDTKTPLTKNDTKVVVTHTPSGKTCEFAIEVGEPTITSINVTTLPNKTVYAVGEQLDLTGMVVKANWKDGRTPTDITSQCQTTPGAGTVLTRDDTKVVVSHLSSGKTCEFNISVVETTFQNDTWANVINYADQGLNKLKEVYNLPTFIGLERVVKINNYDHIVRVVGEGHDELADGSGNKAALTFELVTLLSNSYGNAMTTKWDAVNNQDYTNSILRKNLTGEGTATGEYVWQNNAFSMLPPELQSGIKTVTKKVATTSTYDITTYNDRLFPLTHKEMAQTSERAKEEGTAYDYWYTHDQDTYRIKKDANGAPKNYWLTSPATDYSRVAWGVDYGGTISSMTVSQTYAVSFGFCI